MQAEIAMWKIKAETLAEVCDRMNTEIADITTRVESIELNSSRKKLILTGVDIPDPKDKQASITALDKFLTESLGVMIHIDDYFQIGDGSPRPVVLIFSCLEDKRLALSCKANLKEVRCDGNKVFLSEYLPPTALEKRKCDQKIVGTLKEAGKEDAISYIKGNVAVHGVPYKKMIVPPTQRELISLTAEEIGGILGMSTKRGDEFVQHHSSFIGYSADISSHEQIVQLYKKMRFIKPEARHVVCAYSFQENNPSEAECNQYIYTHDFHDDGEPGAGRVLLDLLERNNIQNKVVFIAQKYGGVKMGSDRFVCYLKDAMSALGITQEEDDRNTQARSSSQNRGRAGNYRGRA